VLAQQCKTLFGPQSPDLPKVFRSKTRNKLLS
jgi:hypothetical protein